MMWPNFFLQEQERMAGLRGRAGGKRRPALTDAQEGKIKLAFFVAIVGVTLTVLAVGTEFWVELNTYKQNHSTMCEAAHFGLWKFCSKKLWVEDVEVERATCGPAELPGEANCSYFKFFSTGENARIFQRTTKKELNIAAAVISLLSITLMVMGSLCITMALSKGVEFLLKPASCFFLISGIMVLISLEVFRHSVRWLIDSDQSIPLEYEYSWSVACAVAAGAVLIFGGGCFILLSLPGLPKKLWQCCIWSTATSSA
ncbi:voltage-dependent calcium channel gamma-6 subunit-like [Gopherus evgoodei]|uniref:Voltage-dependent calcium channel gamma-6 subunit n=1 Tax=Gopherus evgoodei TaxID=1825980 RepID=A0A8C4Y0V2_9SAUR|nr:voltage-dependent calcium channel gamma-6 subunit-like [Gopherus evgoodei]XP_030400812.1 voltage-dependent calcium channel gamma-6 subunit-like [Gopherus evgoodei]